LPIYPSSVSIKDGWLLIKQTQPQLLKQDNHLPQIEFGLTIVMAMRMLLNPMMVMPVAS
jgi:hypothetical protein